MIGRFQQAGLTLIELIFFIVVISIVAATMAPLFSQLFSTLHVVSEGVQGHYLVQERLEKMTAKMRTDQADWFPNLQDQSVTINLDGVQFVRTVQVQGAILNGTDLACTGSPHTSEVFKCVTVSVSRADTGEFLGDGRIMLAD